MRVKISGCAVCVSFWFFALTAAAVLLDRSGTLLAGTLAAFIHEAGHIAAVAAQKGCGLSRVEIKPLGVTMVMRGVPAHGGRLLISLAGAAANILAAGLLLFAYAVGAHGAAVHIAANVCLALLNLFPVEPLDGGVALRCSLEERISPERTLRIMNACAVASVGLITGAGAFILLRLRGSFSLLLLGMWLAAVVLERQLG